MRVCTITSSGDESVYVRDLLVRPAIKFYPAKPLRLRYFAAALLACVAISFYAGSYYNASRQTEALIRNQVWGAALPPDDSVVRDIGFIEPVEYRLEVGML